MISFIGKTVEVKESVIRTPGKRISVKVVWKNGRFQARKDKDLYEVDGWDDLSNVKWIYALPTNSYFSPWSRRPYLPPSEPDKDVLAMTLRFWGKYRHDMTIYGKVVDGVFYQSKPNYNELNIPETAEET